MSSGASEWASERASDASERASGWASGPLLTSWNQEVLNHWDLVQRGKMEKRSLPALKPRYIPLHFIAIITGSPQKIMEVKEQKKVESLILWHCKQHARNPTSINVNLKNNFYMDDPLWKKILQTYRANFAISEMNSQVPPVSLKVE